MTSNIGSTHIIEDINAGNSDMQSKVLAEMRNHFRPEFLNRIDEIVVFQSLTQEDLFDIVDIQLNRFAERFVDKHITLAVSDQAKGLLAKQGYDPVYGARPLKRVIQKTLETPISRMLISGKLGDGQAVSVDVENDGFVFNVK
jgi:ATP-dependent Clp protease ATP-binding subunit ClpB